MVLPVVVLLCLKCFQERPENKVKELIHAHTLTLHMYVRVLSTCMYIFPHTHTHTQCSGILHNQSLVEVCFHKVIVRDSHYSTAREGNGVDTLRYFSPIKRIIHCVITMHVGTVDTLCMIFLSN